MLSGMTQPAEAVPQYPHADLSHQVIGAAIEVHKAMGPGFLEKVYETALAVELSARGIPFVQQAPLVARYKGRPVGHFLADFIVSERIICEIKAADAVIPDHMAQVLNYLRATGIEIGILINFGERKLHVKRLARTRQS
jgi:GxxExxY protein